MVLSAGLPSKLNAIPGVYRAACGNEHIFFTVLAAADGPDKHTEIAATIREHLREASANESLPNPPTA